MLILALACAPPPAHDSCLKMLDRECECDGGPVCDYDEATRALACDEWIDASPEIDAWMACAKRAYGRDCGSALDDCGEYPVEPEPDTDG